MRKRKHQDFSGNWVVPLIGMGKIKAGMWFLETESKADES